MAEFWVDGVNKATCLFVAYITYEPEKNDSLIKEVFSEVFLLFYSSKHCLMQKMSKRLPTEGFVNNLENEKALSS